MFPKKTKGYERGFTLLLSALVASIALILGSAIFTIAKKSIMLSAIGKDSKTAFYAADSAAECALYWDSRYTFFSTSTAPSTPTCDGQTLVTSGQQAAPPYTVTFQYSPNGYCANVTVTKNTVSPFTVIHADGFSTPCATITTSARTLQRSVELKY